MRFQKNRSLCNFLVSNYAKRLKHLNPTGFKWRRLFDVFLPFTAKLSVFFPKDGQLHILNAACPVSARKTRVFVPICRNFDKDAPLQDTLDFNHQIFAEDKVIVEQQYPEDLPIDLQEEVHIRADRSSITYRQKLSNKVVAELNPFAERIIFSATDAFHFNSAISLSNSWFKRMPFSKFFMGKFSFGE